MDFLQEALLAVTEVLCCNMLFETFFQKEDEGKGKSAMLLFGLFVSLLGTSFFPDEWFLIRAAASMAFIAVFMLLQYRGNLLQTVFLSVGYYGLLICIYKLVLAAAENMLLASGINVSEEPKDWSIVMLLSKTVLFLCILFLNRKFARGGSLSLISDSEWLRLLLFPLATLVCMGAFTMEGDFVGRAPVITAFLMVLLNFLVFYLLRDMITKEKRLQEAGLFRERAKNQLETKQYMDEVYAAQRKRLHEFKNHMGCVQGLLEKRNYTQAEEYLKNINGNWVEEIDYINVNHAVINSVLNQKFKVAKAKKIPLILSLSDQQNFPMADEDIVVILANLLDNAIEACERLEEGKRFVKLGMENTRGDFLLTVKNPVAAEVKVVGNRILTSKENPAEHGIGLSNVETAVKKYGGECIYSFDGEFFTISVVVDWKKK